MMRAARIVGVALAGAAALVVALLGPALFMAIPWGVRWWLGEAIFLALVAGLVRLALRTSPPRPWELVDPATAPDRGLHRALAWALQALTLSFAIPLFSRPGWGLMPDWDLQVAWYEALRRTVLGWRQVPCWNPWCSGGFPLAAEAQLGLVSIDTPLVLAFGAPAGLRLAAVLDLMLAAEGARRLARLWLTDPWAAALAAGLYAWNGAILLYTVSGHALTMCHPFLPWILLYAFRVDRSPRAAALLGVAAAASVLAIIQYPTAYAMMIAAVILTWGFLAQRGREARWRLARHVGLAAGVFLALAGWRVALTGLVLADYPRTYASGADYSPGILLHALLDRCIPRLDWDAQTGWNSELASYVGIVPVLAAVASLGPRRRWRWWHTLMFAGWAMAVGGMRIDHPSYWVSHWPVFSSMHAVGRWRLPALLGMGLAAGAEVQAWRSGGPPWRRALAAAAVAFVLGDLALYAHRCLPFAANCPPARVLGPGPPVPTIVNLRRWEPYGNIEGYEAVRRGYGVIEGYCPQLGYDRGRPTARLWLGHPDYRGEFVADGRPVESESWSPNRIEFRLRPNQEVEVNQNPGSYWLANGRRLSPSWRCAELGRRFVARADDRGRLVLEARPPGLRLAAALTAAGVVLAGACWWLGPGRDGTRSLAGRSVG